MVSSRSALSWMFALRQSPLVESNTVDSVVMSNQDRADNA